MVSWLYTNFSAGALQRGEAPAETQRSDFQLTTGCSRTLTILNILTRYTLSSDPRWTSQDLETISAFRLYHIRLPHRTYLFILSASNKNMMDSARLPRACRSSHVLTRRKRTNASLLPHLLSAMPSQRQGHPPESLSSACFGRLQVNSWGETQMHNKHRTDRII
jgi:hypothetical protein